ncbi:MAG: type II secretion system protein [Patescibacteria group bacterium]
MNFCPLILKQKGFTLVELLVAVSVLLIISAVSIPSFNAYILNQNLKQAQEQLKNGIRDAQNRAITGIDAKNTLCTTQCFWAFRYAQAESVYRIGLTDGKDQANCTTLDKLESISPKLNGGALLSTGSGSGSGCVFFEVANADVTPINMESSRLIRLSVPGSSATKCVEINVAGMVKENDLCN